MTNECNYERIRYQMKDALVALEAICPNKVTVKNLTDTMRDDPTYGNIIDCVDRLFYPRDDPHYDQHAEILDEFFEYIPTGQRPICVKEEAVDRTPPADRVVLDVTPVAAPAGGHIAPQDLKDIIEYWPRLSETLKITIMSMIRHVDENQV